MPDYFAPGVYVEEVEIGGKPIEGASTSTAAFVGAALKGPVMEPTLITSWDNFVAIFGGIASNPRLHLGYAVHGFFQNGGQKAYVVRVAHRDAKKSGSTVSYRGSTKKLFEIKAREVGSYGNDIKFTIRDSSVSGDVPVSGKTTRVTAISVKDVTVAEAAGFEVGDKVAIKEGATSDETTIKAISGNIITLEAAPGHTYHPDADANTVVLMLANLVVGDTNIKVSNAGKFKAKDTVDIKRNGSTVEFAIVTEIKGQRLALDRQLKNAYDIYGAEIGVALSGGVPLFKKTNRVTEISERDVTVQDAAGFEIGDKITIKEGTKTNTANIKAISGNILTLDDDLTETYHPEPAVDTVVLKAASVAAGDKSIRVTNAGKFFVGSIIRIRSGANTEFAIVEGIAGKKLLLDRGTSTPYDLDTEDVSTTPVEFDLTVKNEQQTETFKNLTTDPRHPGYYVKKIKSELVDITPIDPVGGGAAELLPELYNGRTLAGGVDDNPQGITSFTDGLTPLEKITGISLVAMPGRTDKSEQSALIEHCENMRYRFAILDSEEGLNVTGVQGQKGNLGSKKGYAALYYPWIQCADPKTKDKIFLPPSGAMAGIYARSDATRGVHKAPANEKVNGAVDVQALVTKNDQTVINPDGINALRPFPGQGIMVWGARTMASDPLWKYVNVRRLMIYLEESIERATQWVVFEPNSEKLWGRVKLTVTEFLTRVWRDGALMGNKPDEAFFVRCDRTTMTQGDIDNGRLICLVGVAPVKPAEFVIFRIAQWEGGSAAKE